MDGTAPPPPLVNVSAKGAEISCSVPANTFSAAIACYAKADAISFLTASDLKPAAAAVIPANVKAAILVFGPAPKPATGLPWQVSVIEDFAADFPDGGALVANLSSQGIRFVIDDNTVTLEAGKTHSCARPEKRDDFNMAAVVFQFQQNDSWQTVSENLLRFAPGMRYLIYAYQDPGSGHPRISTSQDFPPAKAPAAK